MKKVKVVRPKPAKERRIRRACGGEKSKKRLKVLVPVLLLIFAAIGVLMWALPMLPQKPINVPAKNYQGVIELWNVEAFEGGSGSRESWIVSKAAKYEQSNKGLFVHVTTLTTQQLEDKLAQDQPFDIICFSRGAGNIVKDKLRQLETQAALKENFLVAGQINGTQYALPLYAGAYCLFARQTQLGADKDVIASALSATFSRKIGKNTVELKPLVCGFTDYNSPFSALAMSGGKGKAQPDEQTTQYQAYEQFVANKTAVTLLGTQRDLYRLSKREADGKIEQLTFAPLGGYTDLVQYLGISASCTDKLEACNGFVEYLLSDGVQSTLVNLSMFSALQAEYYTTDRYSACEKALFDAYVPNVFGDSEAIKSQRKTAVTTLAL